jgi:hypothetical protein
MTRLNKWAWVAIFAAIAAAPATAQTGGVNSGGQPSGLGLGSGSGALTSSGLSSGLSSGSNGAPTSSSGPTGLPGTQATYGSSNGFQKPTGSSGSSLSGDNFLSGYYANPSFGGKGTTLNVTPGGFGAPLYTSSSGTSTTGTTGARGARGTTGTQGTLGTGRTGASGQNSLAQSGIVVPIPVQINYVAQFQFRTPPPAPTKIQSDLRTVIDNSSLITSGKSVQIVTDVNNNVTLRGTVKNEDEARLIEGVVRLTPGVNDIQNELSFPLPK